jgi:hypothetical protein
VQQSVPERGKSPVGEAVVAVYLQQWGAVGVAEPASLLVQVLAKSRGVALYGLNAVQCLHYSQPCMNTPIS